VSSLLIRNLSQKDNSLFLSKNEIKHIYGGDGYGHDGCRLVGIDWYPETGYWLLWNC
jgi:hypothetical protein